MLLTHLRNVETLTASLLSLVILLGTAPPPSRAVETRRAAATAAAAPSKASGASRSEKKTYAHLPSVFEENVGQAGGRVRFLSRGARHTLALGDGGVTLALLKGGWEEGSGTSSSVRVLGENARGRRGPESSCQFVNMKFVGANPRPEVSGEGALDAKINYFVGRDASKWRTGVRTFSGVRYRGLYEGIDLVFHGGDDGARLEYDFVLAPGSDARDVRLGFDGAERLSLGKGGELLVHTGSGTISQSAPVIYQHVGGERREVAGGYVLRGRREVGFRVGEYDRSAPLVIDPVLVYSTYFPTAYSMAVDGAGAVYAVGTALGVYGDYPVTPGAFQPARRGPTDAFVAKFNPAGDGFSYLTYLGGNGGAQSPIDEDARNITIDAAGNAYVTGRTYSPDFPVVNAFQPSYAGNADGFIAKLNATGSALLYASFLGGNGQEAAGGVAVDSAGAAYVVGGTNSNNFPLKNALQASRKGSDDFFVTKIAPDGKSLEYSTYLGGSGFELGFLADIAVDAAGAAYVGGSTDSADYPVTPGAFQEAVKPAHGIIEGEGLLTKIAPGGAALVYSTYIGGSRRDIAYDLAVDGAGQAHLVGQTTSPDFPTLNAIHPTARNPFTNGFIAKLNAAGAALVYSTYLSGTPRPCPAINVLGPDSCSGEAAFAVATDAAGNAYVTGNSTSGDFPAAAAALQPNLKGYSDAYALKLSPAGQSLWATYLGGNSYDSGSDIQPGSAGDVYLLGSAASDDFPTVNPHRDDFARRNTQPYNSFLAKLSEADVAGTTSRVRFDSASYAVAESGRFVQVNVTRSGDLSQGVSVDYSTGDLTAKERGDYTTARGTLSFAPGEAAKSFSVSVTDDRTVEGDESLTLQLHNLRGAAVLDAPSSARLDISDDDEHAASSNPIDASEFFVRQHYLDFLSREPDDAGLQFWVNEIEQCGADAACREVKRVNVSAAFFLSIEFQEAGFLVERIYRLAFEERVSYRTFFKEAREVGEGVIVGQGDWRQRLDANRRAYAERVAASARFREEFPEGLTPSQYVERLNEKATGALSPTEFNALVAGLEAGTETRGSVLLKVADDEDFRRREFNAAFVLMQYLGYLRRDPDEAGYQFWLAKLNQFNGDFIRAEMVKAFISSDEYRRRFLEAQKEAAFGTPFTLGRGETAVVQPDRLRVTILDVGPDSRCPRDVQCAHAGSISILVEAVKPGGELTRFTLSINGQAPRPHPGNTPVSALGYTFRLLQADPEPPYPNPAPPFQALLQVDKP